MFPPVGPLNPDGELEAAEADEEEVGAFAAKLVVVLGMDSSTGPDGFAVLTETPRRWSWMAPLGWM